jgi:tRNA modification GTPase
LNRLVSREGAIVTEFPGTTRDFIEDSFITRGVPIIVTDTAGIHDSPDPVERIGIEKSWEHMAGADIILFTVDAGKPVSSSDLNLFQQLAEKKVILIINKMDLPEDMVLFLLPSEWGKAPRLEISALYNQGIDELKEFIARMAFDTAVEKDHAIVPNVRHKAALERVKKSLGAALSGLRSSAALDLISIDIHLALNALSEIIGENVAADILDQIFSRFCIGK